MENEIIKKVNEIDNISESQKDRMISQILIQEKLIEFLSSQIEKISSKNELKSKVIEILKDRIEDDENPIPITILLRLFEILSKDENDAISNILGVIKDSKNPIININSSTRDNNIVSVKDMNKAKKVLDVLDFMDNLKKSEMSLDEIENNKEITEE